MVAIDTISAAVLVGGKSSRMRRSKADLPFRESTFLHVIVSELQHVFQDVLVCAGTSTPLLPSSVTLCRDLFPDRGPLAGIHSAMVHAKGASIFVCSTDVPLMQCADVLHLIHHAEQNQITIAVEGERKHPLFGLYPVSLRDELETALVQDRCRVQDFLTGCSAPISLCEFPMDAPCLRNVNTTEEYEALIKMRA